MITIEKYIAENNTNEAQRLLTKYGLAQTPDWNELHAKLRAILTTHKDQAAKDFAAIDTPYKRLIEANLAPTIIEKEVVVPATVAETKHNSDGTGCGCGGKCNKTAQPEVIAQRYFMADGTAAAINDNFKYMPHITIAVLAFLLGYEISKHNK